MFDRLRLKKKDKKEEIINSDEGNHTTFVGFVLLDQPTWSPQIVLEALESKWGIQDVSIDNNISIEEPIVIDYNNGKYIISLVHAPVPNEEAVINASTNWMWPEAVEMAKTHQAHLIVSYMGDSSISACQAGVEFVKLCSACLQDSHTIALNTNGTVYNPEMYIDFSEDILKGDLPIFNMLYFGLYDGENGVNAYTFGMNSYNQKLDIEVIDSQQDRESVFYFLLDMASYVISNNVTLCDGETIGFTAEQKLPIQVSAAVCRALEEETIKIQY